MNQFKLGTKLRFLRKSRSFKTESRSKRDKRLSCRKILRDWYPVFLLVASSIETHFLPPCFKVSDKERAEAKTYEVIQQLHS